jgi:hypothetical protein
MRRIDWIGAGTIVVLVLALLLQWPTYADDRPYCSAGGPMLDNDPRRAGCRFGPVPEAWLSAHPWWPVLLLVAVIVIVGITWWAVRRRRVSSCGW